MNDPAPLRVLDSATMADHSQQRVPGRQVQAARLQSLLGRAARGQEDAFAELYDETCARIYGVVVRVIRAPELAREVTAEAYREIWRQSARYDPARQSVLAWMTGLAHRLAVRQVREGHHDSDAGVRRDVAADVDRVFDGMEQRIEVTRVQRALDTLTEIQREALSLAYFGGYTDAQVAKLLDLPLSVTKTRIRDGLIGLRDALGLELGAPR